MWGPPAACLSCPTLLVSSKPCPTLLASSRHGQTNLWRSLFPICHAGKPIASLAFHVSADVLAIGCGHKLYMWEYAAQGKLPVIGECCR